MSVDCQTDSINRKVSAFANYLNTEPNQENRQNLTKENLELLSKFAEFMKKEKLEKHMHEFMGDHRHGKFGKHGKFGHRGKFGHHGMFGHHFGKHGSFGKHGHGKHGFAKHDQDFAKFGPEFVRQHGLHHRFGKHGQHCISFQELYKNTISGSGAEETGRNPSPPAQASSGAAVITGDQATANPANITWNCAGRLRRRHAQWNMCPYRHGIVAAPRAVDNASQTVENIVPQDNLATMVENITIVTPPPSKE